MMLGRLFDRRAVDLSAWGRGDDVLFQSQPSGQIVTQDTALNLLTVWSCVTFIADTISTLPVDVMRRDAEGAPVEVASPPWLRKPNAETDVVTFFVQIVSSLLLDGNAYLAPFRSLGGVVADVWVLNPQKVDVRRDGPGGTRNYYVAGQRYPGEILHVPAFMPPQGLKGLSPIDAARVNIGAALGSTEHGARFFGQGTTMTGVIEVPGDLSNESAKKLRENWVRQHGGSTRAFLPGVLTGGAKWQSIQMTAEQAQFLETRKFHAAEISGQLFRLDPTMLGIPVDGTSLTYQNIESRGIHLVRHTLLPWIVRLENALTYLLPRPQYAKLNVGGLMRADLTSRFAAYATALAGAPFMDVDQVRDLEDWGPMPEAPSAPPPGDITPEAQA